MCIEAERFLELQSLEVQQVSVYFIWWQSFGAQQVWMYSRWRQRSLSLVWVWSEEKNFTFLECILHQKYIINFHGTFYWYLNLLRQFLKLWKIFGLMVQFWWFDSIYLEHLDGFCSKLLVMGSIGNDVLVH